MTLVSKRRASLLWSLRLRSRLDAHRGAWYGGSGADSVSLVALQLMPMINDQCIANSRIVDRDFDCYLFEATDTVIPYSD